MGEFKSKHLGRILNHIDSHFSMSGTPFEVICRALGGIRYYDLEVFLEDGIYACHMSVLNGTAAPTIRRGFRAERIVNHTRYREATEETWNYPIAA